MTRDFFQDASQILHQGDQGHFLLCAWESDPRGKCSANIRSRAQLEWYRDVINRALDEIAQDFPEPDPSE